MINGFDINPLVNKMHLMELEKEMARTREHAAGSPMQSTARPVKHLRTRVVGWFRRRGVAQRPDPASSFLPT